MKNKNTPFHKSSDSIFFSSVSEFQDLQCSCSNSYFSDSWEAIVNICRFASRSVRLLLRNLSHFLTRKTFQELLNEQIAVKLTNFECLWKISRLFFVNCIKLTPVPEM